MAQPLHELIDNILVSENIQAIDSVIKSTQLESKDLKDIIIKLVILLFEIKERNTYLQNNPAQPETRLDNCSNYVRNTSIKQEEKQAEQRKCNCEQIYNDLIDELEKNNEKQEALLQKQLEQKSITIKEKELYIDDLKETINKMLNKSKDSGDNNEAPDSLLETFLKKENQQDVEQIVHLKQRVRFLEPLKQFQKGKVSNIDSMLDELQKNLKELQEESQILWEQSKQALTIPFEYDKNNQETELNNLINLQSLLVDCICKYSEWFEKCKQNEQNQTNDDKLLVSMKTISFYNQNVLKKLTKLLEEIIKKIKLILQKYKLIEAQYKDEKRALQQIQRTSRCISTSATETLNQIPEIFKVNQNLKIKYCEMSSQFQQEFENLAIQFVIEQLHTLSLSIYKEFKKFCTLPKELRPEVFMNQIKIYEYPKALQLYQQGFRHLEKFKHLLLKSNSLCLSSIVEQYQIHLKDSSHYFSKQQNLLQKQEQALRQVAFQGLQ